MQPEISELIVLQIIYTLLLLQHSGNEGSSGNAKVSLVKLTNEIQNNILINQMVNNGESKLDISDILMIVKRIFPNQRISLVDGQLSFHNLHIKELQNSINERLENFFQEQNEIIKKLEDEIVNPKFSSTSTNTTATATTASSTSASVNHIDPKREKLLQLYRDTVLNKLQAKGNSGYKRDLQGLYDILKKEKHIEDIVLDIIEIQRIKNDTPASVHDLQLMLQKSISDAIMSSYMGSETWKLATQLQLDFDDTVQFMRRALE